MSSQPPAAAAAAAGAGRPQRSRAARSPETLASRQAPLARAGPRSEVCQARRTNPPAWISAAARGVSGRRHRAARNQRASAGSAARVLSTRLGRPCLTDTSDNTGCCHHVFTSTPTRDMRTSTVPPPPCPRTNLTSLVPPPVRTAGQGGVMTSACSSDPGWTDESARRSTQRRSVMARSVGRRSASRASAGREYDLREGRGVSDQYGVRAAACPISTG